MPVRDERVDTFADATGDHQWIHVDPEKAAAGPFGSTKVTVELAGSDKPACVVATLSVLVP